MYNFTAMQEEDYSIIVDLHKDQHDAAKGFLTDESMFLIEMIRIQASITTHDHILHPNLLPNHTKRWEMKQQHQQAMGGRSPLRPSLSIGCSGVFQNTELPKRRKPTAWPTTAAISTPPLNDMTASITR